ncbi:unnamed protein product [Echinostoma caproni]|uniref:OCRE domain-containing protein n=1 Tax=Echinostoma caproni TaxID=27848 RepID=A0A183AKD0_9TREM|nr:unnamed protein product [Echinostoma caproni]
MRDQAVRVTPVLEAGSGEMFHVPVSSHHPNAESSDEDFFDAEEANSEFSIYLPPTSEPVGEALDRSESGATLEGSHSTPRSDSTSAMSTSLLDEGNGIPPVNEVAYEYESDVYCTDEDEDDTGSQMKAKTRKPLREARVIQPRTRRHESRSATLVPSGDRVLERQADLHADRAQTESSASVTQTVFVPSRQLSRPRRTVNFSEPLSMLQRLTEDFEYSACLDRAAQCQDSLEQMAHVAAFTVSSYATTAVRVNKPFNPLLSETYECDRTDDLGWRSLAEQVTGAVTDKSGAVRYVLNGTWDESMEYAPVVSTRQPKNGKPVLETGPARVAWQRNPLPPDAERMHYFTLFALQLNEEEPGVCPTDSRLRPDQRLMEIGKWDEANREKVVLEEKQRHRRRQMAAILAAKTLGFSDTSIEASDTKSSKRGSTVSGESGTLTPAVVSSFLDQADSAHRPLWFERQFDQDTGEAVFTFNGKYWNAKASQDWSMCPEIY